MENLRNLDKKIIRKMRRQTSTKKNIVMKKDNPGDEQRKNLRRKPFLM